MIRRKPTKGFDSVFTIGLVSAGMWVILPILAFSEYKRKKKDEESLHGKS